MNKTRRIMAIIGIALLLSMYIFCFIFALIRTEAARTMFRMALAATIAVPIVLYGCLVVTRAMKPGETPGTPDEPSAPGENDGPSSGIKA